MQSLALVVHVILAIGVIGLVLIQHGKGADAGAAFGSGASATVFGARGSASFLTRATTVLAGLFFLTSVSLFYLAAHRDRTVRSVTESPALIEEAPSAPVASDLPGGVDEGGDGQEEAVPADTASDLPDAPAAPAETDEAAPEATAPATEEADDLPAPPSD